MVILSYGKSVWNDFINAYNNHVIVYCRASSNSNPATGAQGRMAFMAYVNNGDNPTEVEFQYYRSMSSHSSTQMGDQVFIYKLTKTGGWSVTVREASIKEISASATGNLSVSYSSNKVTLSGGLPAVTTTDNDKMLKVVNGVWTIVDPNTYSKTETDAAIAQSTAFHKGDTFMFNGAQITFRTLSDLSAIYFRYNLPKTIGSDVTSFSIAVTGNSVTWFSNGLAGTVAPGATASNVAINGRSVQFALPTSATPLANSGFGICELNATVTFT